MKRAVLSILMIFIFVAPLRAGEVYMWTDEKGVKHITETPPPKPDIKVETMKYKRDEPLEVNTSQEKQKKIKEETGNQAEKSTRDVNPRQSKPIQIQPERRPEEQQTQEIRPEEQELERHRVKEEERRVEERH